MYIPELVQMFSIQEGGSAIKERKFIVIPGFPLL